MPLDYDNTQDYDASLFEYDGAGGSVSGLTVAEALREGFYPRPHDSKNKLLYRWCGSLSRRHGDVYPPKPADSDNVLLQKICKLTAL